MISASFASAVRAAVLALTLAVLLDALPAGAQQRADLPVVGWLVFEAGEGGLDGFRQGLREHGYVEGQNIAIEVRTPEEGGDRLVEQIQDLARLNIKVLITGGVPATLAAKRAALLIPVVFIMADPVGSGVVASLAHPGGSMTGQSLAIEEQFAGKWLELLKEAVPHRLSLEPGESQQRYVVENDARPGTHPWPDTAIRRVARPQRH